MFMGFRVWVVLFTLNPQPQTQKDVWFRLFSCGVLGEGVLGSMPECFGLRLIRDPNRV